MVLTAGLLSASLVIERGGTEDLRNMPQHFYDKYAYFKLQSMVEIC